MASQSQASPSVRTLFCHAVDMASLTRAQAGFINSVRMLDDEIRSGPLSAEELKASVAEMFPPAVLFGDEINALPYAHRALRTWLDTNGANLTQHSSRRIPLTLATSLYDEAEDRDIAETFARELVASGKKKRTNEPEAVAPSSNVVHTTSVDASIAHKIAMRFRDERQKFSGAVGEFFNDFVADYTRAASDYDLSSKQKLQYMHNLFTGDAKRFYNKIESYAATFPQAVEMIEKEYNSCVRQDRCKNYLSSLRVTKFVADGLETSAALEKTYKVITKLAPQVPQSHRGEAHKVEFLRGAVVGYDWATEPLSRIATHNLSFQMSYGELESALHLAKEGQLARVRDSVSVKTAKNEDDFSGIMYQSQGRYLNRHQGLRTRPPTQGYHAQQPRQSFGKNDPLKVMGCFNCGEPNHCISDCPKAINAAIAAKRRLEYYAKKRQQTSSAHMVLYELCSQLDSGNTNDPDDQYELGQVFEIDQSHGDDIGVIHPEQEDDTTPEGTDIEHPIFPLRD